MRKPRKPTSLLRYRVFEQLAAAENEPHKAIADMQLYVDWIISGRMPTKPVMGPRLVATREAVDRGQ